MSWADEIGRGHKGIEGVIVDQVKFWLIFGLLKYKLNCCLYTCSPWQSPGVQEQWNTERLYIIKGNDPVAVLNSGQSCCTLGVGVIGPLLFCMSVYTEECTGSVMKTEYRKAMGNYSELGRCMSVSYSDRGYRTPVGVVGLQYQSCLNSIIP